MEHSELKIFGQTHSLRLRRGKIILLGRTSGGDSPQKPSPSQYIWDACPSRTYFPISGIKASKNGELIVHNSSIVEETLVIHFLDNPKTADVKDVP